MPCEGSILSQSNRYNSYLDWLLVLQGGGALGAYQAGVYQALHEAEIEPDWIIGTSIGAINAGLIAGNALDRRLSRLQEFWSRVTQNSLLAAANANPFLAAFAPNAGTIAGGVPGFFEPNPGAWLGAKTRLGPEQAAYYSTEPLYKTLCDLTDPMLLNAGSPRLTVGAANVQTGEMRYFDSREETLTIRHIMASGALPPAFPAVRIDGELYWDGGVLSNTPVEAVFDDNPRRGGLIFAVHMWGPHGSEPDSLWSVMGRQKDLQYASRAVSHIRRQKQIHKLRHIIAELAQKLPAEASADPRIAALTAYGCTTTMHVVRLLAPPLAGEDHSKDIDFSAKGIHVRWEAGYADTKRALTEMPWSQEFDSTEGFLLHEARAGHIVEGDAIRGDLSPGSPDRNVQNCPE